MGKYLYSKNCYNEKVIYRYEIGSRNVLILNSKYNVAVSNKKMTKKDILREIEVYAEILIGEFDTLDNPVEVLYG